MLNSISKIKKNLQSVQEEIKEDYKKGVLRTKHLRWDSAESDISIAASIKNTIVQWSAAKSLKFQNFSTTSTSSFDLLEKHGEMSSEGGAGHSGQGESISSVTGNSWNSVKWFVYLTSASFTSFDVHTSDSQLELTFISTSAAIQKFSSKTVDLLSK